MPGGLDLNDVESEGAVSPSSTQPNPRLKSGWDVCLASGATRPNPGTRVMMEGLCCVSCDGTTTPVSKQKNINYNKRASFRAFVCIYGREKCTVH